MTPEIIDHIAKEVSRLITFASPVLYKHEAAKYLRIGKNKIAYLVVSGKIIERHDELGRSYFLKEDLNDYLRGL